MYVVGCIVWVLTHLVHSGLGLPQYAFTHSHNEVIKTPPSYTFISIDVNQIPYAAIKPNQICLDYTDFTFFHLSTILITVLLPSLQNIRGTVVVGVTVFSVHMCDLRCVSQHHMSPHYTNISGSDRLSSWRWSSISGQYCLWYRYLVYSCTALVVLYDIYCNLIFKIRYCGIFWPIVIIFIV